MVVAIAVQRFEDTICPGCGLPASVTQGDHNVGRIEVHDQGICHGCEAVESYKSDPNRQTFPGQKLHLKVDWD